MAVAFAALGAELKGLLGLPVEERANTEPHQHDAERQGADLTERNAQLAAELGAQRSAVWLCRAGPSRDARKGNTSHAPSPACARESVRGEGELSICISW